MVFYYRERSDFFSLQLNTRDPQEAIASIRATWEKVFPGLIFSYFFLDEQYSQQYVADTRFGNITATFSGLAILIACFGLYGLSSFTITQRRKEIGIRKVLGASVSQIAQLLTADFIKVILVAAVLAFPLALFLMEKWLSTHSTRVNLNALIFIVPILIVLVAAFVTVSLQTLRAASANPTNSLKEE